MDENMDALKALQGRISMPRLSGEVPSASKLEHMFQAALRAPDHGQLKPWRFLLISGDDRYKLADLFANAQLVDKPEMSSLAIDKVKAKPLRAPLVIVAIVTIQSHPKVPEIEQVLSAGAAVQNLLLAAYSQNIGAIWRTGSMAYHQTVLSGLGLSSNERIIGFVYIGEALGKAKQLPKSESSHYFKRWPESK